LADTHEGAEDCRYSHCNCTSENLFGAHRRFEESGHAPESVDFLLCWPSERRDAQDCELYDLVDDQWVGLNPGSRPNHCARWR